jgi:hypothetical protein
MWIEIKMSHIFVLLKVMTEENVLLQNISPGFV